MDAGALRHRVSIELPTQVSDGHDGYARDTWGVARERIAALIAPLAGHALDRARQIDPRAAHEVTVRYWAGWPEVLTVRARITWHDGPQGPRYLELVEPARETEPRVALTMACREAA